MLPSLQASEQQYEIYDSNIQMMLKIVFIGHILMSVYKMNL
jgi:hypothetical protein